MSGDGFDGLDKDGKVIYSNPEEDPANAPGLDSAEHMAAWGDAILNELRGIREAILALAVLYGAHNRITGPGEHDILRPTSSQGFVSMGIALSESIGYLEAVDAEIAKEAAAGGS